MQIHPKLILFYQMDSFSVHGDPDKAGSPDYFQQAIIAAGCINFHTGILSLRYIEPGIRAHCLDNAGKFSIKSYNISNTNLCEF